MKKKKKNRNVNETMSRKKEAEQVRPAEEEEEEEEEGDEEDMEDDDDEVDIEDDEDGGATGPHVEHSEVPESLVQEDIDYSVPARKQFYLDLINFMSRRGTPIKKFPQVARRGLKKKKKKKTAFCQCFNNFFSFFLFSKILICICFMML
jgi:hypothetical protein